MNDFKHGFYWVVTEKGNDPEMYYHTPTTGWHSPNGWFPCIIKGFSVIGEVSEWSNYEKGQSLNLHDVRNNEVAFANLIEKKWKEYRMQTNNEDAWLFKQWLVCK